MKATIEGLEVVDVFAKTKESPWGHPKELHHIFSIGGLAFEFWIGELHNRQDLVDVFALIVSEAIVGVESFGEFYDDFCDTEPQVQLDAWTHSKETASTLRAVYSGDFGALLERLGGGLA